MSFLPQWFFGRSPASNATKTRRPEGLSRRRRTFAVEQLEARRVLAVTSLSIYTPTQSIVAGNTTGTIKVQLLDQFGRTAKAPIGGEVILLGSNSGQGTFLNAAGTAPIASITIPVGASAASFKYTDTKAGTPLLTLASGLLKPAHQSESVAAAAATQILFVDQSSPPMPLPIQTIQNTAPATVTIELLDAFGNVAKAAATSTIVTVTRSPHGPTRTIIIGGAAGQEVALSADSPTAKLLASQSATTQINKIVIPTGQSTATFFYSDTTAGSFHVFADSVQLGSAQQTEMTAPDIAPTITAPATLTIAAGATQSFATTVPPITVDDVDAGASIETVKVTTMTGSLLQGAVNVGSTVTLTGTIASLKTQLSGLTYQAGAAADTIKIVANDGTLSTSATIVVGLAPDIAPTITPGPGLATGFTVPLGATFAFTGPNTLTIADADATATTMLTVTLSVTNGSIAKFGVPLKTLTITDTLANINAILMTNVTYIAPPAGAPFTSDILTITATDGVMPASPVSIGITLM